MRGSVSHNKVQVQQTFGTRANRNPTEAQPFCRSQTSIQHFSCHWCGPRKPSMHKEHLAQCADTNPTATQPHCRCYIKPDATSINIVSSAKQIQHLHNPSSVIKRESTMYSQFHLLHWESKRCGGCKAVIPRPLNLGSCREVQQNNIEALL